MAPTPKGARGFESQRFHKASMVVSSGDVTKACVSGLPSLRLAKLRLYDVTIEFFSPGATLRFHWPMHGPHAFASTVAPCPKPHSNGQPSAGRATWAEGRAAPPGQEARGSNRSRLTARAGGARFESVTAHRLLEDGDKPLLLDVIWTAREPGVT